MQTINTYYEDYPSLQAFVLKNRDVLMARNRRSVLVQIFSGICDKNLLAAVTKQVCDLLPGAQVIGTTTNGEIMNGMITGFQIVLSFSVFHNSDVKVGLFEKNASSDYMLGQTMARRLNSDTARVLITFSTGLTVNGSKMLQGIQSVNPGLPVAGGNAGDNLNNQQVFVFSHEGITNKGVVGALLTGSDLNIIRHSHLGWQPIGKDMTVTRAEGTRVYSIDHIPAFQVYRHYLGTNEDFAIIDGIEFPLTISTPGLDLCRVPFRHYDDDSLGFFGEISEGARVRFSFGHIQLIKERIDCLLQTIRQQPVESIFVYSCAARRSFLQDYAQVETLPLQDIAPTLGFFTSGEFYHTNHCNHFLNNTMTTLCLSESSQACINTFMPHAVDTANLTQGNNNIPKDKVMNRSTDILRALTCLVNSVTLELDERTLELQKANEKLLYSSTHDALTGLYNRGFFENEMARLDGKSHGIVMCDVDGLKLINDTMGHNMGDEALRATANILTSLSKAEYVVARIGGDEFGVILPHTPQTDIESFCGKIRQAVAQYTRENQTVPLNVSLGYSSPDAPNHIAASLKKADDHMYQDKFSHKQSNHNDLAHTFLKTLKRKGIITEDPSRQHLLVEFGKHLGLPQAEVEKLILLMRFHDVGKASIADHIKLKSDPLTAVEQEEMQRHCEAGYRIACSSADLQPIATWILMHHEWWNGRGYPSGVQGEDIPIACRLLSIINAFTALADHRPDGTSMGFEGAFRELMQCAGTELDPVLTDQFIQMMKGAAGPLPYRSRP